MYGTKIKIPAIKLSATPRLAGLDGGAKMGKSLGNAIYLSDSPEEVRDKVRKAVTDPARITKDIPGNPEICNVAKYHKIFTPDRYEELAEKCRTAQMGCVECKNILVKSLNDLLEPMREKRAYYEDHMDEVKDIIITGSRKASEIGDAQVAAMREAMHIAL